MADFEAELRLANRECMFKEDLDLEPHCGKPAVLHFVLQNIATMGCPEHLPASMGLDVDDQHAIGGVCGLPGATWINSSADHEGRCEIRGVSLDVVMENDELAMSQR